MPAYEELIGFLVKNIVTKPEDVEVTSKRSENGIVKVMIRTAPEDIGRVIGKHGVTINAIRYIAKASSIKPNEKVEVDLLEE